MPHDFQTDFNTMIEYIKSNTSDRELAIVHVSYIERYLLEAISSKMPGLDKKTATMFEPDRFLGPLGARIHIARALNVIDERMSNNLKNLSRIRNRFAHNISVISFDDVEVESFLLKIKHNFSVIGGGGRTRRKIETKL